MNFNGWYPRRRGVLEHLRDGRMSPLDLAFHDILCQLADAGTGIVPNAAAWYLAREMGLSRKLAQKYLIRLESKRYIRRIRKSRSHATQPALIHQYLCTDFPHKGMVLNAWSAEDYRHCEYVPVSREVSREVSRGVSRGETYPLNKEFKNLRSKETPAAKPAAPLSPAQRKTQTTENEQRRRIEQRDLRLAREDSLRQELRVGMGPDMDLARREYAEEQRIARARETAENSAPVPTEVSRATGPAALSTSRARDIGMAAAAAAGTGSVDRAAPPNPKPITHARESMQIAVPGIQSATREKPGPQPIETMTKDEIDAELRALKAKLASVGNMR